MTTISPSTWTRLRIFWPAIVTFVVLAAFDVFAWLFILDPKSDRYGSDIIALLATTGTIGGAAVSLVNLSLSAKNLAESLRIQRMEKRPLIVVSAKYARGGDEIKWPFHVVVELVNLGQRPGIDIELEYSSTLPAEAFSLVDWPKKELRSHVNLLIPGEHAVVGILKADWVVKTFLDHKLALEFRVKYFDLEGKGYPEESEKDLLRIPSNSIGLEAYPRPPL